MKRLLFVILLISIVAFGAFGAVKFKGDFYSIADMNYYIRNLFVNITNYYFGLNNVNIILNLDTTLELTSDVYGKANLILVPVTTYKHLSIENLMINYYQKASKVKIVPFYRYSILYFEEPENMVSRYNSWVVSSSIIGIGNITNSGVDPNGFYVDSSRYAWGNGIPYILRPVTFYGGEVVNMPGMGEDTTNLALSGREMGGFYAEQRAKSYLWQVFTGFSYIDNFQGSLNLSAGGNLKLDVFEFENIASIRLGFAGIVDYIKNNIGFVDYYDLANLYYSGFIPQVTFVIGSDIYGSYATYDFGPYFEVGTEFGKIYGKAKIVNQGSLFLRGLNTEVYNDTWSGNGLGGVLGIFSDYFEGLKVQVDGGYLAINVITNTNQNASNFTASRLFASLKVYGDYELQIGGLTKFVLEGSYVDESKLNYLTIFKELGNRRLYNFRIYYLDSAISAKVGLGLFELFDFLDVYTIGVFENTSFAKFNTNVIISYNVTKIEARVGGKVDFYVLGFEGVNLNLSIRFFNYVDNLGSSDVAQLSSSSVKNLSLTYITPDVSISYEPSENIKFSIGYGYKLFGDLFDVNFGNIFDAYNTQRLYQLNNVYSGMSTEYIANIMNSHRFYVDFKVSF